MTARNISYNAGSPEGVIDGNIGDGCYDTTNGLLYTKRSGTNTTTGWLAGKGVVGSPQTNRFLLAAVIPTAGDTIEIQGTDGVTVVYEFRNSSMPPVGGTAGRVWIFQGGSAADARTNLINAINGVVDATNIEYNGLAPLVGFTAAGHVAQTSVVITEITPSEATRACSSTMTVPTDVWDNASTTGGLLPTRNRMSVQQKAISANEVAAGECFFSFGFTPLIALVINHNRPQNEAWAVSGNRVMLTLAGGATPNNQPGDIVTCLVIG